VIKKEIIPIIKQVAKETNTTFIDLYTPFYGKKDLLSDGVHPNATGAKYLALEVYKAISK
jgi:lysophospholipase L1-like esterase